MSDLHRLRVGTGVDVHGFVEGGRLVLAGVDVPHTHGLEGHSDADLIAHAVTDALLGGAGLADIGTYFPAEAVAGGADSMGLLAQVVTMLREQGTGIINVDCVVAMQAPKLAPHRDAMRDNLAAVLGVERDRATVRATTTDHLGFVGRNEGAAAIATALVLRGDQRQPATLHTPNSFLAGADGIDVRYRVNPCGSTARGLYSADLGLPAVANP